MLARHMSLWQSSYYCSQCYPGCSKDNLPIALQMNCIINDFISSSKTHEIPQLTKLNLFFNLIDTHESIWFTWSLTETLRRWQMAVKLKTMRIAGNIIGSLTVNGNNKDQLFSNVYHCVINYSKSSLSHFGGHDRGIPGYLLKHIFHPQSTSSQHLGSSWQNQLDIVMHRLFIIHKGLLRAQWCSNYIWRVLNTEGNLKNGHCCLIFSMGKDHVKATLLQTSAVQILQSTCGGMAFLMICVDFTTG